MDPTLTRIAVLLIIAMIVAIVARRFSLPYTIGLVFAGIAFALLHSGLDTPLTHTFIYDIILPPLLFEAALNIHWQELRRDMAPVLVLASFGVVISAIVVAAGMMHFLGWPFASALIFSILIAATDPVAVIALFKDIGITGRIRLLLESESLFNDGVAAVFYTLALAWVTGAGSEPFSAMSGAVSLVITTGGGIMIGALVSAVALAIAGRTDDHLVETALTIIVAYGSFMLSESLHVSGVLSCVAAGLIMGNIGALKPNVLTERGRVFVLEFWEFIAFLANSLVFLLIGLRVATIPFTSLGWPSLLLIIGLVLIGRAAAVYLLCVPFIHSRVAISFKEQHVLWWGGLRGALALALVLALPVSMPLHNEIVVATFGVVIFSVIVQGLTISPLLKKLDHLGK